MSKYPEITNLEYHEMTFEEIDRIKEKIASGKTNILINESQLFLYLNQISQSEPNGKRLSSTLRWMQNISIFGFIGTFVFLFINWKISPLLFLISIITQIYNRNLAKKYIFRQCTLDRVFLKFALGVGLVKLQK